MKKISTIIFLSLLIGANTLFAQEGAVAQNSTQEGCENGWCWGEDPTTAKEKNILYNDDLKMKNYAAAATHLEWLLTNTPNLNKAIYINGVKIYEQLLKAEKSEAKQREYQDKILKLHDDRIKYFGEEDSVLPRKGAYAYIYLNKRDDVDNKFLFDLYDRIFKLSPKEASTSNLTFYMVTAMKMTIDGKNAGIKYRNLEKKGGAEFEEYKNSAEYKTLSIYTEDFMLGVYDAITEALEANIENSKGDTKKAWEDCKEKIDGLLPKVVSIDCDFIKDKMSEKLISNPSDIGYAKRTIKYMLQARCLEDPLFIVASQAVFSAEPKGSWASVIASRYMAKADYDSALYWKKQAFDLYTEEPEKQADLQLEMGLIYYKKGQKSAARTAALKAAELDTNAAAKAYSFIGDLYYGSGNDCMDKDPVKSRAVYIAAYSMYQKAGDSDGMKKCQAQFPANEDIFTMGKKEGDSIEVGCWVGGTVSLKKRP